MTRVWAPHARAVDLDVEGRREPMAPADGGWWRGPELPPGTDYGFALDGGDVLADPRSPWQPYGADGRSRTTAGDFAWTEFRAKPLAESVVYELHVGTFTEAGTFDAARERLPHLAALGVDVVEVMPVHAFPGARGWGYDAIGLYAVHELYGGPAGFKRFVEACHRHGLAVALDVVYNHFGPGSRLDAFGPYLTDAYRTPWGPAVNFDDRGSDEVRAFVVDNARWWVDEYHVDGLRLDAVHAFHDRSAVHIVEELTAALPPHVFVVAESDLNDPRVVTPRERGGWGATAQWSDDFHHALHAALTGERHGYYADFGALADVATALRGAYVYTGQHSRYRDRRHGRPVGDLPATKFLGYAQTHDQVGNRAFGERLATLVPERLRYVAATLVLTAPFVPMLFMGEEWGATTPWQYFTDHTDPHLAEAVRKGRRMEFGHDDVPDPQDPETFRRSTLDWSQATGDLLDWHRALIALRKEQPPDGTFADARADGDVLTTTYGDLVVVANAAGGPVPRHGRVVLDAESVAILRR